MAFILISAIWPRNDRRRKAAPHVEQVEAEPEPYGERAVRCAQPAERAARSVQPEREGQRGQPEERVARCAQHAAPEHRVRFRLADPDPCRAAYGSAGRERGPV